MLYFRNRRGWKVSGRGKGMGGRGNRDGTRGNGREWKGREETGRGGKELEGEGKGRNKNVFFEKHLVRVEIRVCGKFLVLFDSLFSLILYISIFKILSFLCWSESGVYIHYPTRVPILRSFTPLGFLLQQNRILGWWSFLKPGIYNKTFKQKGTEFLLLLLFLNFYICATRCCRPLIFQTMHSVRSNSLSLKYQRFTSLSCKDIDKKSSVCGKKSAPLAFELSVCLYPINVKTVIPILLTFLQWEHLNVY